MPPEVLTPDDEKEALEFVKIVAPFRLDDLKNLKTFDPREYQARLMDILHNKDRLDMVKRNDPDQYQSMLEEAKLDQQSFQLSEQYRKANSPDEKQRIKSQLTDVLNQLFDVREKNKQGEIKHLEEELARLKSTMTDRQKNKNQIVTERLKEMLDEMDSLKW